MSNEPPPTTTRHLSRICTTPRAALAGTGLPTPASTIDPSGLRHMQTCRCNPTERRAARALLTRWVLRTPGSRRAASARSCGFGATRHAQRLACMHSNPGHHRSCQVYASPRPPATAHASVKDVPQTLPTHAGPPAPASQLANDLWPASCFVFPSNSLGCSLAPSGLI